MTKCASKRNKNGEVIKSQAWEGTPTRREGKPFLRRWHFIQHLKDEKEPHIAQEQYSRQEEQELWLWSKKEPGMFQNLPEGYGSSSMGCERGSGIRKGWFPQVCWHWLSSAVPIQFAHCVQDGIFVCEIPFLLLQEATLLSKAAWIWVIASWHMPASCPGLQLPHL